MSAMRSVPLASLEAGIFAVLVTQPFWVIKTRMVLNMEAETSEIRNFYQKSKEIHTQYGFKGYMKGLSLNLWLSGLGISQMIIYEGSKTLYESFDIPQTEYS